MNDIINKITQVVQIYFPTMYLKESISIFTADSLIIYYCSQAGYIFGLCITAQKGSKEAFNYIITELDDFAFVMGPLA